MNMRIQNNHRGFTLIELLVVVSLIALLLGFSVPLVFKIDELSRDRSGVNTVGVAVTAARAFATRQIADRDTVPQAEYSGAAVLVTPMGQLRIIGDLQDEAMEAGHYSAYGYDNQTSRMEPITLPRGVGLVGISRTATGGAGMTLLAPPFAIRFNRHGQLVAEDRVSSTDTDVRRNLVYYDSDQNGTYSKSTRPGGYDPSPFDPDISDITSKWHVGNQEWILPFETLECVVGVIAYAKADFEDAGGKFPAQAPVQGCTGGCGTGLIGINKWMMENGTVMFFSRNTGNILRTKNP